MQTKTLMVVLAVLLTRAGAWYPDYSVMVTDFVLPYDFLAPPVITSLGLEALGPHFNRIYSDPVDNTFQNPAHLGFLESRILYFDIAGEEIQPAQPSEAREIYPLYDYATVSFDSPYWSPYRYEAEPHSREPIARILYLGPLPGGFLNLRLGASLEYFYNRETFYQPYWYWGIWRNADALGGAYAEESQDPYQDYREVETGENLQTEDGYRINTFAAYPLTSRLALGLHVTRQTRAAIGNYLDMDRQDKSPWAEEYLYFYDTQKDRDQSYRQTDISAGLLWNTASGSALGISAGRAAGTITRDYLESDTSQYYSLYNWYGDTTRRNHYLNTGASNSDKHWKYDGISNYGEIHGRFPVNPDIALRFSAYLEQRRADLTEAEDMWRRTRHESRYWNQYDSIYHDYEYRSSAALTRTGTGDYTYTRKRLSLGSDWSFSETLRFIGGLVFDQRSDKKQAVEPFAGDKYAYNFHTHNGGSTVEETQEDVKQFSWHRREQYTTLAVPMGIILDLGENFEVRLGLTKVLQNTDITEKYDLVVTRDFHQRTVNGSTTITADSLYVEGHSFPGVHIFTDKFEMNGGATFKYKDTFRITAALQESILDPRTFKIGVEFRW